MGCILFLMTCFEKKVYFCGVSLTGMEQVCPNHIKLDIVFH